MSKKPRTPRTHTKSHTKRHGKHHKKSRDYVKAYAPYLPLIVSIIASMFLSFWRPAGNTLAYSTSMSVNALLTSTNGQRTGNGKSVLTLNSQLNNSAQAKANDMAARNYWSHNTPSGQEPWVFFDNAGYSYLKAGENLAYGFATSADTVAGWMNSPTHKANMLDGAFTEVGFGFVNSANFNGDGQQTIVVAHYAKPQVAAAPAPAAPSTPAQPQTAPATTQQQTPAPAPKPQPKPEPAQQKPETPLPVTTDQPIAAAAPVSRNISKVQTLTNGNVPWAYNIAVVVTGIAIITILLRYSLKVRHLWNDFVHDTERFILHHPLLDSTLVGLAILGAVLSRTSGTIL